MNSPYRKTCITKFVRLNVRICQDYGQLVVVCLLCLALAQYLRFEFGENNEQGEWWSFADTKDGNPSLNAFEEVVAEKESQDRLELKIAAELRKKLIVFERPAFDELVPYSVNQSTCGPCEVSYNHSLRAQADAVIYHYAAIDDLGVHRSFDGQLLVWMNQESPWTTFYLGRKYFETYDSQFNLTMTYRRDSDIYFPYFSISDLESSLRTPGDKLKLPIAKKKLVAWVAGNCVYTKGARKRLEMVKRLLQLGLEVDIFGSCVWRPIPGGWPDLPSLLSRYKFYLSFENALHCRDYITEKTWWNALRTGAVPVIWGPERRDVEAVLPPDSFLFVEDYARPEDLVERLAYLDRNDDAYAKYLAWQGELMNKDETAQSPRGFCQLCLMLHTDQQRELAMGARPRRHVKSLGRFWYGREGPVCLSAPEAFHYPRAWYQWSAFVLEYRFHAVHWRRFYALPFVGALIVMCGRRAWR